MYNCSPDVAIRTMEDDLKHLNVGVRAELKLINKRRSLRWSVVEQLRSRNGRET